MIQESEVIVFLCSVGILIFMLSYRKSLWRIPESRLVVNAYAFLVAGWGLTIVEGVLWEATLNFAEHLCYALSAVLLFLWLLRLPAQGDGA